MGFQTKLYVGSLPEGCDNASLEAIFAKYGKVDECDIVKNYAFVHMANEDEAKLAIDALHNSEFMGSKITVEVSEDWRLRKTFVPVRLMARLLA